MRPDYRNKVDKETTSMSSVYSMILVIGGTVCIICGLFTVTLIICKFCVLASPRVSTGEEN